MITAQVECAGIVGNAVHLRSLVSETGVAEVRLLHATGPHGFEVGREYLITIAPAPARSPEGIEQP